MTGSWQRAVYRLRQPLTLHDTFALMVRQQVDVIEELRLVVPPKEEQETRSRGGESAPSQRWRRLAHHGRDGPPRLVPARVEDVEVVEVLAVSPVPAYHQHASRAWKHRGGVLGAGRRTLFQVRIARDPAGEEVQSVHGAAQPGALPAGTEEREG